MNAAELQEYGLPNDFAQYMADVLAAPEGTVIDLPDHIEANSIMNLSYLFGSNRVVFALTNRPNAVEVC